MLAFSAELNKAFFLSNQINCSTFGAPYPHDSLKTYLSGEIASEVFLEFFCLGRIVNVMERRVVKNGSS